MVLFINPLQMYLLFFNQNSVVSLFLLTCPMSVLSYGWTGVESVVLIEL